MILTNYKYDKTENRDEYSFEADDGMGSTVTLNRWADGKITIDDVDGIYFDDVVKAVELIKSGTYPINAKERR